ncbi:HPP family protein [Natronosalvus rutilus]|uniref:HPP family protein n=1 Tax=Natronosalvus rutilus TaxID=2953753 RepID=A0A9E7NAF4_9EURY|nr:HPP family protein [Natronosalvus rutilus]UTF53826.1 HPP family protein [Natronosalvus rutilus]
MDDRVGTTLHTGLLLAVTGTLAWLSGLPLLFPSLGPSAFVLALFERSEATRPRRVVGGHLIGVVAGLLAYHVVAGDSAMTVAYEPGSLEGLRLATSGVLATTATAGGMLATDTRHPPACATTLIVSLGLLSTVLEGAFIVLAVAVLVGVHRSILLATN